MTNTLFSVKNAEGIQGWLTCPTNAAGQYRDLIADYFTEIKAIRVGEMKLEEIPQETREEVLETLKAFNRCSVIFEYGKFNVTVGVSLRAQYPFDYFVCGDYKAEDVYTPEQRRKNYREMFARG